MKRLTLLLAILIAMSLAMMIACGDDDDDDDDGPSVGGYTCADGCSIIYDDCGTYVEVEGYALSESECVEACIDEGGIDGCATGCMDAFAENQDCDAFGVCAEGCL